MRLTFDVAGWLDDNEPESEAERDDLLRALETLGEAGDYRAGRRCGAVWLRGWGEAALLLRDERARAFFLREVAAIDFEKERREGFRGA